MTMENLRIENKPNAPEIFFDCEKNVLNIRGESYPENAREFYNPVTVWVREYLAQLEDQEVTLNVELVYFNSSTAKILMNLFDMLEDAADEGNDITVNWIYDKKNLNAVEYGEDFQEDLESVHFNLIQKG